MAIRVGIWPGFNGVVYLRHDLIKTNSQFHLHVLWFECSLSSLKVMSKLNLHYEKLRSGIRQVLIRSLSSWMD